MNRNRLNTNTTTTTTMIEEEEKKKTKAPNESILGQAMMIGGQQKKDKYGGADHGRRFPEVLHDMLSAVEKQGMGHIISWQPHGRSIMVHQPGTFVKQILPNWFNQTKWSSFQRQLNIYGFLRITSGREKGAYYHALFLRGKEELARDIPRVSVKGPQLRRPVGRVEQPNFYNMPPLVVAAAAAASLTSTTTIALDDNHPCVPPSATPQQGQNVDSTTSSTHPMNNSAALASFVSWLSSQNNANQRLASNLVAENHHHELLELLLRRSSASLSQLRTTTTMATLRHHGNVTQSPTSISLADIRSLVSAQPFQNAPAIVADLSRQRQHCRLTDAILDKILDNNRSTLLQSPHHQRFSTSISRMRSQPPSDAIMAPTMQNWQLLDTTTLYDPNESTVLGGGNSLSAANENFDLYSLLVMLRRQDNSRY